MLTTSTRVQRSTLVTLVCTVVVTAHAAAQSDAAPRPLRLPEFAKQISDPVIEAPVQAEQTAPLAPEGTPVVPEDASAQKPVDSTASTAGTALGAAPVASEVTASRWASQPLPATGSEASSGVTAPSGRGAQDALEVGGSLAGVIFLIFVLRMLIRRAQAARSGGSILGRAKAPSGVASILARYPVGRGQQVALLAVGQRILVVHQSGGAMVTLSEITDAEEVAQLRAQVNGVDRETAEAAFAPTLDRVLDDDAKGEVIEPVDGLGGLVAETVDLTAKRRKRLLGGVA